jgi:hypothetical protein
MALVGRREDAIKQQRRPSMSGNENKEYGEGNYKASRQYNDATKKFVESGRVDEAARDAAPTSDAEAADMRNAETEAKKHAKEEDPALRRGQHPQDDARGKPVTDRSADSTKTPKPGQ